MPLQIFACAILAGVALAQTELPCDIVAHGGIAKGGIGYHNDAWANSIRPLEPGGIFRCNNEACVQQAVLFARRCGLAVSVRSGGHSIVGASSCVGENDCIQIDVSGINHVAPDEEGAVFTVGPGATLKKGYETFSKFGATFPGGMCGDVAFGGHLQSSSWGYLTPSFGSGMEYVKSFRIVLSNSTIVEASNATHPDLFWAVRGSAPGSWGVVTEYKVEVIFDAHYPHAVMYTSVRVYTKERLRATLEHVRTMGALDLGGDFMSGATVVPALKYKDKSNAVVEAASVVYILSNLKSVDPNVMIIMFEVVYTGRNRQQPLEDIMLDNGHRLRDVLLPDQFDFKKVEGGMSSWLIGKAERDQTVFSAYRYHATTHHTTKSMLSPDGTKQFAAEIDRRVEVGMLPNVQLGSLGFGYTRHTTSSSMEHSQVDFMIDDSIWYKNPGTKTSNEKAALVGLRNMEDIFADDNREYGGTPTVLRHMMTLTTEPQEGMYNNKEKLCPNKEWWGRLVDIKTDVDPHNVFRGKWTVPPRPSNVSDSHRAVISGAPFRYSCHVWIALLVSSLYYT